MVKMMRVWSQAHRGLLDTVGARDLGVAITRYINLPVIESSHLFTCSHYTVPFAPSNICTVIRESMKYSSGCFKPLIAFVVRLEPTQ